MNGALSLFDPVVSNWFLFNVGQPTPVQEEGWPAIASGEHALISAPTGTGKTLAAFLVWIDRLRALALDDELREQVYVIYISPLKALGNDIQKNLKRPISGIPANEIRVGIRTGDTEQSERRQMIKHPPHILITTPESLYLLLSSKSGQNMLHTAQAVILDELHAVIDTKRGAHLMLSLSRLDALCGRKLQRIALSATIHPLQMAADYLSLTENVRIVAPKVHKDVDIEVNSALTDMRVLPEGTIWPELSRIVYAYCLNARSVIAFVEGRMQAEKLAYGVNQLAGPGFARTHHGCVSKEQRLEAENQLKSGELRLLCATSSMELGIDVGEIDLVVQIGCPMTVSSTLQRLGRAGHNPGRTSVMHIFPRMALEMVFCGMTAKCALSGEIEPAHPPAGCLDIVAQHVVSMAAMDEYEVNGMLAVINAAPSFKDVTRDELEGVLRMLAGDFEHELDHPAKPRVLYDRIHGVVRGDAYSRMLAVSSGGTIPDRGWYPVVLNDGTRIGELDEEYVFEARVGDKFLLGAFAWRMTEIQRDRVVVASASTEGATSPFWRGDGMGRAYEIGLRFGRMFRELNEAHAAGGMRKALHRLTLDDPAVINAERALLRQFELSGCLPDDKTIIVEHFTDPAGDHQLMVHSVFGKRVNLALDMMMRHIAKRATGLDVHSFCEDDGFLLYLMGTKNIPDGLIQQIDPDQVEAVVRAMLPSTPLFSMSFRYNAARAMMMGVRKTGRQPLWIQRMRGAEVLSKAAGDVSHPLIQETLRECLNDYLDMRGLREVLRGVQSGAIQIREYHTDDPSPMALPLRRQVEATLMYEYSPTPTAAIKLAEREVQRQEMIKPGREQLELTSARKKEPGTPEQLHALLMAEGDILADELEVPVTWLTELSAQGRALYIEPGLWICAEQAQQYDAALNQSDEEARLRIIRRCLRYRGGQSLEAVADRYVFSLDETERLLKALHKDGAAVFDDGYYYHGELYQRAQRETIAMRRREMETLPPERLTGLLTANLRRPGSMLDQLRDALKSLKGISYPIETWENVILPSRVAGYRPKALDDLLTLGDYFWVIDDLERLSVCFYPYEELDWDRELEVDVDGLSDDERAVYTALKRRGASFAHAVARLIGGKSALDVLMPLMEKGLVRADSFAPLRQAALIRQNKTATNVKRKSRARVAAQDSGRWEVTRPLVERTMEEKLNGLFDRYTLLCRETCTDAPWSAALDVLRIWEYTGLVRRGYYVSGLSGAQFIRAEDYQRALILLKNPNPEILWLSAIDPMQPFGHALKHAEESAFMLVPGTYVALSNGVPIAVMERQGECLRIFDPSKLDQALERFVQDYEIKRVYANKKSLVLKQYPEQAKEALEKAGFVREMRDFVLWRKAY